MRRVWLLLLAISVAAVAYSCGDGDPGVVPEPANQAPVPVGAIPSQEVPATDTANVELSAYFNDPDGDRLIYSASTSNAAVVTASVSASTLSMVATGKGTALVTVTARDPGGLTATQNVDVTVIGKPGFLQVVLQHPEPDIGGGGRPCRRSLCGLGAGCAQPGELPCPGAVWIPSPRGGAAPNWRHGRG